MSEIKLLIKLRLHLIVALAQLFISSDRSSWRYDALIHSSLCMTKLASEMHETPQIFSTIFREGVKNWGKGGKGSQFTKSFNPTANSQSGNLGTT